MSNCGYSEKVLTGKEPCVCAQVKFVRVVRVFVDIHIVCTDLVSSGLKSGIRGAKSGGSNQGGYSTVMLLCVKVLS